MGKFIAFDFSLNYVCGTCSHNRHTNTHSFRRTINNHKNISLGSNLAYAARAAQPIHIHLRSASSLYYKSTQIVIIYPIFLHFFTRDYYSSPAQYVFLSCIFFFFPCCLSKHRITPLLRLYLFKNCSHVFVVSQTFPTFFTSRLYNTRSHRSLFLSHAL